MNVKEHNHNLSRENSMTYNKSLDHKLNKKTMHLLKKNI